MTKTLVLKVEQDRQSGQWLLLMACADGIDDVLSEHPTKAAAQAAKRTELENAAASYAAERHYQTQYAYACGYYE